ncbi:MAG: HNH endonuclease [Thermoplasmata archaeon]|nr:HNH endonuclease [Thermoplasmata archaeon]
MENVEVFLKFDPRYGDAESLDRRIFDAAVEYFSYVHAKKIADMTKEDAYQALLEYRDYAIREELRWTYLENKIRSLMHDDNAFCVEESCIISLRDPNLKGVPIDIHYQVFKRDLFQCRYCGTTGSKEELEVDYILPPREGGSLEIDNLVTACVDCKNKVLLARSRPATGEKPKKPKPKKSRT